MRRRRRVRGAQGVNNNLRGHNVELLRKEKRKIITNIIITRQRDDEWENYSVYDAIVAGSTPPYITNVR